MSLNVEIRVLCNVWVHIRMPRSIYFNAVKVQIGLSRESLNVVWASSEVHLNKEHTLEQSKSRIRESTLGVVVTSLLVIRLQYLLFTIILTVSYSKLSIFRHSKPCKLPESQYSTNLLLLPIVRSDISIKRQISPGNNRSLSYLPVGISLILYFPNELALRKPFLEGVHN